MALNVNSWARQRGRVDTHPSSVGEITLTHNEELSIFCQLRHLTIARLATSTPPTLAAQFDRDTLPDPTLPSHSYLRTSLRG